MQLADLIDLEVRLAADEEARRAGGSAREDLERRDAAFGRGLAPKFGLEGPALRQAIDDDHARRREVALAWLSEVRAVDPTLPGRRIEEGLRALSFLLVGLGAFVGAGTAWSFLAYDGKQPINVFGFLAVFCVFQVALVAFALVFAAWSAKSPTGLKPDRLQRMLRHLSEARWLDRLVGGSRGDVKAALGRTLGPIAMHRAAEGWLLFGLVQRFGVAFNVGAVAVFLYLLAFTDLAFGWSTTFTIEGESFHAITQVIAAPWALFLDDGVPSADLVRWTRFAREGGGHYVFDLGGAARPVGAWWPFLLLSLLVYGLLPRVIARFWADRGLARALSRARLDHAAFDRLFDRMCRPSLSWEAPDPSTVGQKVARSAAPRPTPRPKPAPRRAPDPDQPRPTASGLPRERPIAAPKAAELAPISPSSELVEAEIQTQAPADEASLHQAISHPPAAPAAAPSLPRETDRPHILWGRLNEEEDSFVAAITGMRPEIVVRAGGDLRAESAGLARLREALASRATLLVEAGVQPTKDLLGYVRRVRELLAPPGIVTVCLFARDDLGHAVAPPAEDLEQWQLRIDAERDLYLRLEVL